MHYINILYLENTMNLEDQVTSLELSKKIKEIGIEQKSNFFYDYSPHIHGFPLDDPILDFWRSLPWESFNTNRHDKENFISAFTASELITLLPHRITLEKGEPFNSFKIRITKSFICKHDTFMHTPTYIINYHCDSTECDGPNAWLDRKLFHNNIWDENFCNALAKTLISIYELDKINEKTN